MAGAVAEDADAVDDGAPQHGAAMQAGNAPGRSLRLVVVGEPVTDPVAASPVNPADVAVLDFLYDGLTRWDDEAGTWVPEVAVSVETNRNARVWTFALGERRFSDGRPIDAEAVVAALERLRAASALVADRLDHVASVRVVDDSTVQMRLTRPDAMLPALLSHPLFGITPPVDRGVDLDGRVGSGALRVAPGGPRTLIPVGSESRAVVEVEIMSVRDVDAGVALVRSGDADVIHVPPSYAGPVDGSVASGVVVAYALNAGSPRLASVEARRTLTEAIAAAAVAGPLPGLAPTRSGGVEPAARTGGTLPDSSAVSVTIVASGTNGEGASGPTAEAGADLAVAVDPEIAMAATLAAQWGDAGVDVVVEHLSLGAFVALVSAGDHEVIRSGWVDLHPGDRPHWHLVEAGSTTNVTGVRDQQLASQMRRARRDAATAPRTGVDEAIADLGVLLPIGRLQVRLVTAPGIDFVSPRSDGSLIFVG